MTFEPRFIAPMELKTIGRIIVLEWLPGTDVTEAMFSAWRIHNTEKKVVIFTFNGALISIGGVYND